MKAFKSMVLLTTGALLLSACDKKSDEQTSATEGQDTTMGAGASQDSTSEGAGAISDEAANDELTSDQENYEEDDLSDEVQEEEHFPTDRGTGRSGDDYEMVDETSSEPNDVRGGRDARMVPKNNEVDNTSSEPDRAE